MNTHARAPARDAVDASTGPVGPGRAAVTLGDPSARRPLIETAARWLLPLLPVAAAWVWLRLQHGRNGELGFPLDDSYIHFQFARNLGTGHGFAFNPSEPTPGATSPLWVLILGGCRALGLPIEPAALALGIALVATAAWLTHEVARRAGIGPVLALIAGLAVATSGRLTWASLSGMEIGLATVASLLVVRLVPARMEGTRRAAALGLAAGLAATARPEMMLLVPLVLAVETWRLRGTWRARPWLVFGLVVAGLVLPYMAFSLATSGRPLPNTFYAKAALELNNPHLARWRLEYVPLMLLAAIYDNPALGVLLVPGLAAWAWRRDPRTVLVLLWPLAFWAYALVIFPRHFALSRYTMPLTPFLALMSAGALEWLRTRVPGALGRRLVSGIAAVAVLASAAWSQTRIAPIYLANVDNILQMQVRMGHWVADHTPTSARIATHDVGAITYIGGRYCVDTVGLVSADRITHALANRRSRAPAPRDAVLVSYLREKQVDYCIVFPSWYPALVREPWLHPVWGIHYPNSTGGGDDLVVYQVSRP